VDDRGHGSFINVALLSNEPHTFSLALLESRHCSCLFMLCQYGPLQKIVRLALSKELLSSSHRLFPTYSGSPLAQPAAAVSLPGPLFTVKLSLR